MQISNTGSKFPRILSIERQSSCKLVTTPNASKNQFSPIVELKKKKKKKKVEKLKNRTEHISRFFSIALTHRRLKYQKTKRGEQKYCTCRVSALKATCFAAPFDAAYRRVSKAPRKKVAGKLKRLKNSYTSPMEQRQRGRNEERENQRLPFPLVSSSKLKRASANTFSFFFQSLTVTRLDTHRGRKVATSSMQRGVDASMLVGEKRDRFESKLKLDYRRAWNRVCAQ